MTFGVSERLKVYVPEPELRPGLSGLVTLEAEFPLLCRRAWLAGACDGRSLAMTAKCGVDDDCQVWECGQWHVNMQEWPWSHSLSPSQHDFTTSASRSRVRGKPDAWEEVLGPTI
jgi:hypothetical protein